MDIEHDTGEAVGPSKGEGQSILLPRDALPGAITILPQEARPVFPGQAFPLVMHAEHWQSTVEAVQARDQNVIGVVASRGPLDTAPNARDLFEIGTLCRVHRVHRDGEQLHVLLEGLQRFQVRNWLASDRPLAAQVRYFPESADPDPAIADEIKAYAVAIINTIKELVPLNPLYGEELKLFLTRSNPNEPAILADFAASLTTSSLDELQQVLETFSLMPRLERVLSLLQREVGIARTQQEIRAHVESTISANQREALLKQQLDFIQRELGLTKDDRTAEIEEFRSRLAERTLPAAAHERIEEELGRLALLETGSPEYGVVRNWLEWTTDLPWGLASEDAQDLAAAAAGLDAGHDGLHDIKERILEFLGLGLMKGDVGGSILLFVGPPGVGKTSLGRAIADAMGRKFHRFSVGGMRDEAEIKGHRRTYVGALPGKLIRALREAGTENPVIMLDEIDKIGASYQGDPASALLEVLDPEQNGSFRDHYLDLGVDLSKVLFVCTANQLDTIPGPLLDRMEIIQLSGYLAEEKIEIARNHLLPRQIRRAGLKRDRLRIHKKALRRIVDGYAREAGVRQLEKQLGTIVRKAVMQMLRGERDRVTVRAEDVETFLGQPRFRDDTPLRGIGIVTGLAWTAMGGATLPVELRRIHDDSRGLTVTGQLGDVMQESARIALDHVVADAARYGVDAHWFDTANLHIHVPAGATPKDGPSAGVTMATALVSLATGQAPARDLAMTGELTLTGKVYPVGGIREKLLAAKRSGVNQVLLPAANEPDVAEIPAHVVAGLRIDFVDEFADVVAHAFP